VYDRVPGLGSAILSSSNEHRAGKRIAVWYILAGEAVLATTIMNVADIGILVGGGSSTRIAMRRNRTLA
jgi:hypothetical protein